MPRDNTSYETCLGIEAYLIFISIVVLPLPVPFTILAHHYLVSFAPLFGILISRAFAIILSVPVLPHINISYKMDAIYYLKLIKFDLFLLSYPDYLIE